MNIKLSFLESVLLGVLLLLALLTCYLVLKVQNLNNKNIIISNELSLEKVRQKVEVKKRTYYDLKLQSDDIEREYVAYITKYGIE